MGCLHQRWVCCHGSLCTSSPTVLLVVAPTLGGSADSCAILVLVLEVVVVRWGSWSCSA
jgi:hypothetical protein